MNYKRPSQTSWKCPICQKHEPWETLKVCNWTKKVASQTHSEVREVFLCEEAPLWKLSKDEQNLGKGDRIETKNLAEESASLDDIVKMEPKEEELESSSKGEMDTRNGKKVSACEDVICLDSDSDEETNTTEPVGSTSTSPTKTCTILKRDLQSSFCEVRFDL